MGDSIQTQGVLNFVNNSGRVERGVETRYARLYGMHRLSSDGNVPKWEEEGTWYREYSIVLRPQDIEGAQSLTFHYDRDTSAEEAWAYDPRTRRTRKIVHNHYETSFGLNFLVEDHAGFNGHLHAHTWHYQGEQVVLVPGFLKGARPTFSGKNNWYPLIPWELRKAVIVEAIPKDPNHPYGKRRLYIDRQLFSVLYGFIYDRDGAHWRTLFHCMDKPKFVPGNADVSVPAYIGNVWIDYKTDHASLWVGDKVLVNQPLLPEMFTVKELMRKGK
jgi:hypothetical protein